MKTIVFAYHDIGYIGVTSLIKCNFEIQAIFTHLDSPKENIFFRSVSKIATENNIPVFAPYDVNNFIWIKYITKLTPEVIFSFHYRKLLSNNILNIPKIGGFNLHSSLLPRYRGHAPLNWVLINGEKETGVTLHRMQLQADSGNIIAQKKILIENRDDAMSLHNKLCNAAKILLQNSLISIKNNCFKEFPQNENLVNYVNCRKPEDGYINWNNSAEIIINLIRAVTYPWPGAFSFFQEKKFIIWKASIKNYNIKFKPSLIISNNPFIIACGSNAIKILLGQIENNTYMQGNQLAKKLGIKKGILLNPVFKNNGINIIKILILGINGFIGSHLTEFLLKKGNYEIYGLDINQDVISKFISNPLFHFLEGDICINFNWIKNHVKKCDIIFPLAAVATPMEYVRNPLEVFKLNFEDNLKIVRLCVKYKKRIIFPSTSEVYGMCTDSVFDENKSVFIVGPIHKQRWIYSVSKQLLDRIIWAYGIKKDLKFTLFRPFNWIGPHLDNLDAARIGNSRVITQLILSLIEGLPMKLIDSGIQKRCFTDINDGISALFKIIENKNNNCNNKIINIGNPNNEVSIQQLANILLDIFNYHPLRKFFPSFAGFHNIKSSSYYGKGYQDIKYRKPSIHNAKILLNWTPKIKLKQTIYKTLDFFLKKYKTYNYD